MIKKILLLSGLCLGGILSASDPEAALRNSVQNLEFLYYEAHRAKKDEESIPRNAIHDQTKKALDDFISSSSRLTPKQRLLYSGQIYRFTQAFAQLGEY